MPDARPRRRAGAGVVYGDGGRRGHRRCADEGIDADIVKPGVLYVARSAAQLMRMHEGRGRHGRGGSARVTSASWTPPRRRRGCGSRARWARVHPRTPPGCSRHGWSPASPGRSSGGASGSSSGRGSRGSILVRRATTNGTVRAPVVLRCLEGYTASIHGQRRTWLPMNSAMIVTEPLPDTRGTRSAGAVPRSSATSRMPIATPSARPTAASRSAGAASRTATARAPTSTDGRRSGPSSR